MSFVRYFAVIAFSCAALAQSPQATISGTVTDAQKAAVPAVEISALSAATGQVYRTTTNETGFYSLPALPIGSYTFSAEKGGFRKAVRNDLVLTTGQSLEINLTLDRKSVV